MILFVALATLATNLGLAAAGMATAPVEPDVSPLNYTDGGFVLQGFLAFPEITPAPAVIIIPDCKSG